MSLPNGRGRRRACVPTLLLVIALSAASGCGHKTPARVPPPGPPVAAPTQAQPAPAPVPSEPPAKPHPQAAVPAQPVQPATTAVGRLEAELDEIFKAPDFNRMLWSVDVQSLSTGEILYRLNPASLVMPASNMKIITLAAAAERLGWDFSYETKLFSSGPVDHGVLRGDLVVAGSGDPTINDRSGDPTALFHEWAATLQDAGIGTVQGRIVADDRSFEDEMLGAGWAWDYLVYGYAAPVAALQYLEDVAEVVVRPGGAPGVPVGVTLRTPDTGLVVENHAVTGPPGSEVSIELHRMPGSSRLDVTGALPAGAPDLVRTVAVDNPARFFAQAFKTTLVKCGIAVEGDAVAIRQLPEPPDLTRGALLAAHRSPPLSEIAKVLMRVSQNLYAETLVKTLGLQAGEGTTEAGQQVVEDVLSEWGIAPDSYVLADGSGLSRYNFVTAETIVQVLRHVYDDPRLRDPFLAALPVGAQPSPEGGTLSRRFRGTRAAGNVRAKTGSISNVRALSGFVQTADGEPLVFSIIANNFTQPQATMDAATDLAVELLANFSRIGTEYYSDRMASCLIYFKD
jgi:D-alanyl-D-alanine carboxypeptidase/D-alanyl-D-alanine-endopeptidase (penicillin-binding protein 4)